MSAAWGVGGFCPGSSSWTKGRSRPTSILVSSVTPAVTTQASTMSSVSSPTLPRTPSCAAASAFNPTATRGTKANPATLLRVSAKVGSRQTRASRTRASTESTLHQRHCGGARSALRNSAARKMPPRPRSPSRRLRGPTAAHGSLPTGPRLARRRGRGEEPSLRPRRVGESQRVPWPCSRAVVWRNGSDVRRFLAATAILLEGPARRRSRRAEAPAGGDAGAEPGPRWPLRPSSLR